MMDANQRWDVQEAINHMKELQEFKPLWIEEPTSPDDILGHAAIAKALKPLGIGVATGEHCQNRVIFKQLLQAEAISFCQIDSCRVGGVNENLAIILMASKFGSKGFSSLFLSFLEWIKVRVQEHFQNSVKTLEKVSIIHSSQYIAVLKKMGVFTVIDLNFGSECFE